MRNAGKIDMEWLEANKYQYIMKVMFEVRHPWFGCFMAHIKQGIVNVEEMQHPLLVETAQGSLLVVEKSWLKDIPRKQGTPAKSKRKPIKGSKPWLSNFEYVDYDPSLIKVGTKVKCRDKKIRTVENIKDDVVLFDNNHTLTSSVYLDCGKDFPKGIVEKPQDIMKILVEKKVDKPVHDRYNGYEVGKWHFWQGTADVPPVDGDVEVEYWLRGWMQQCRDVQHANHLGWKHVGKSHDIIAFKIVC